MSWDVMEWWARQGLMADIMPPAEFGEFLASAFYLVGFVTAAVVLYKHLRPSQHSTSISPQPVRVAPEIRMATHEEMMAIKGRVDGLENRLEARHKELIDVGHKRADMLRTEIARATDNLHARVDLLTKTVGELVGEMKRIEK